MSELSRPISLSEFSLAIKDLSIDELKNIKKKLDISINRLEESNKLMSELLARVNKQQQSSADNDDDDDDDEFDTVDESDELIYKESIKSNEFVIENQINRIEKINEELSYRGDDLITKKSDNNDKEVTSKNVNEYSLDNDIIDSTAPNSVFL
ncbi:hypothetical protein CANARDRAFT_17381 [[Candida] arabinofermentans NRRL YB-2248]|uniref:Uncharacterized protein n=1 Tax=[Candida] arabinofermentans NRRL YB-2248 TaxID=983967 RepID=A0A1E4T0X3_9ASCO|nr:hypothetical protein CANARDRAFT_17381 [[Candida] arabinofermentans NRRL YB-2248]